MASTAPPALPSAESAPPEPLTPSVRAASTAGKRPGVEGRDRDRRVSDWVTVSDSVAARLGLDDLLAQILDSLREAFSADAAYVVLSTEDEASFEVRATSGLPGRRRPGLRWRADEGVAGRISMLRLPTVVADVDDSVAGPVLRGQGLRSLVTAALLVEGRVVGAIHLASRQPGRWDNDDAVRLQQASERIALAIDSARLRELERQRRGWLAFLAEASELLAGTLDPERTLAMVAQLVVPRLADWCVLHAADDAGDAHLAHV